MVADFIWQMLLVHLRLIGLAKQMPCEQFELTLQLLSPVELVLFYLHKASKFKSVYNFVQSQPLGENIIFNGASSSIGKKWLTGNAAS